MPQGPCPPLRSPSARLRPPPPGARLISRISMPNTDASLAWASAMTSPGALAGILEPLGYSPCMRGGGERGWDRGACVLARGAGKVQVQAHQVVHVLAHMHPVARQGQGVEGAVGGNVGE